MLKMISLEDLKNCVERCKIAGDVPRFSSEYQLASVMILFSIDMNNKKNEIILIKKKSNLRKHSGQIAFPGGKRDLKDFSLLDTAIRETYEEINLNKLDLKVLGELPYFFTGTGYKVKPFLSVIKNYQTFKHKLTPDTNEIEKIIVTDASNLLNPKNQFRIKAPTTSSMQMTWRVKYNNENIWGLTARLLTTLSAGLKLREFPPCNDI